MSALVANRWEARSVEAPSTVRHVVRRISPWSERMDAVRDTLIVLGLQLVFRATLILRRWNY